jgi:hypothetical protein
MTSLVTCDQQIASFTSSLGTATPAELAALAAALAAAGVGQTPGVGTGGFVQMTSGTSLPNNTAVTLATWTAPRTGKIAVSFNYLGIPPSGADATGSARITKNGTIVAVAVAPRHHDAAIVAPSVSRAYLDVAAGDVINGVAFMEAQGGGASVSDNLGVTTGLGLAAHYFA